MADAGTGADLDADSSDGLRWLWAGLVLALVIGLLWYVTHPPELRGEAHGTLRTTPGEPVYIGVARVGPEDESVLLREVQVEADPDGTVVRPLICRDGTIGTTSRPAVFCRSVVPAVGSTLGPADQLVLAVSGTDGPISLDAMAVSYRSGLQLGTQQIEVGATVRVIAPDRGRAMPGGDTTGRERHER